MILHTIDEFTEATWIVSEIEKYIGGSDLLKASDIHSQGSSVKARFSDFAVLYRTHHVSRQIEQALEASGIPYQRIGSDSLFEQPEVAQVIEYMKNLLKKLPGRESNLSLIIDSLVWKTHNIFNSFAVLP